MSEQTGIEFSSPSGWRTRWLGAEAYQVAVALIIMGCTFVMLRQIDSSTTAILKAQMASTDAILAQHRVTQKLLNEVLMANAKVMDNQAQIIKAIGSGNRILAYVLTRTDKQRQELNLEMPEELKSYPTNRR